MDRRGFVRALALSGAAPLVASCARTLRLSPDEMVRRADIAAQDPDGLWAEAAAYARWTPSPHNTQPWLLRVRSADHCELLYNPARLLPKTDPTSAFTVMGLTMFAEFMSVALAPRGFGIRAGYIEKPVDYAATEPRLFANLELVPSTGEGCVDRGVILARQTSRLPYDGHRVEESALKSLAALAGKLGHEFEWSGDDELVEWIVDLNRFTLFDDLDRMPERTELRRWIRTTDFDAAAKKDGLWSECLRFPGWLLKSFFDDHDKWGKGWRASICGKMLVAGMRGTRTVGWWSGPFAEPGDWIRAGQVLGQSWLGLASRGIQIHPFGSVITNPVAHGKLEERLQRTASSGQLWLLTRMGRSDVPPRSYRLNESAIFLNSGEAA